MAEGSGWALPAEPVPGGEGGQRAPAPGTLLAPARLGRGGAQGYQPGIAALRPLGVGEILDGAFAAMRTSPAATLGITVTVAAIAQTVISVTGVAADELSPNTALLLDALAFVFFSLFGVFVSGMLSIVVSEAPLGRRVSVAAAARRLAPRLPGLVGLSVVVTILSLLGLVALGVGAIYVGVVLALAPPVFVLEGGRVGQALRRSRELVRGAWWRTFGILTLSSLVAFLLGLIFLLPAAFVVGSWPETFGDPTVGGFTTAGHIVNALGNLLAMTIGTPVLAGATVMMYVDRRIRREGLDVTLAEAARRWPAGPRRP